ncbi:MAG TPA: hypothetical protein VF129_08285 [Actinomycetota bacterium]
MIPAAELRVYQPLEAFPAEEQARWERYIVAGARTTAHPRYADQSRPPGLGFLYPAEDDAAHVKVLDGRYYVCPERTKLRVLAGLVAFRDAAPFEGSEAFLSRKAARRARRQLGRLRRRQPWQVATIMRSPWHAPVRWFVLFDADERRLVEFGGRHHLSYLTTTRKAVRRAERAVPALRHTELGPIADLIVELHQWLTIFDQSSLLELDYGGLCDLMTWDEMDDDHSAYEVAEALKALAAEEFTRSAELYQAALSRSNELRARESSN